LAALLFPALRLLFSDERYDKITGKIDLLGNFRLF
jgi:hypothetical protein